MQIHRVLLPADSMRENDVRLVICLFHFVHYSKKTFDAFASEICKSAFYRFRKRVSNPPNRIERTLEGCDLRQNFLFSVSLRNQQQTTRFFGRFEREKTFEMLRSVVSVVLLFGLLGEFWIASNRDFLRLKRNPSSLLQYWPIRSCSQSCFMTTATLLQRPMIRQGSNMRMAPKTAFHSNPGIAINH